MEIKPLLLAARKFIERVGKKPDAQFSPDERREIAGLALTIFNESIDVGCTDCVRDVTVALRNFIEAGTAGKFTEPDAASLSVALKLVKSFQGKREILAIYRQQILASFRKTFGLDLKDDRKAYSVSFAIRFTMMYANDIQRSERILPAGEQHQSPPQPPATNPPPVVVTPPADGPNAATHLALLEQQVKEMKTGLADRDGQITKLTDALEVKTQQCAKQELEIIRLSGILGAETSKAGKALADLAKANEELKTLRKRREKDKLREPQPELNQNPETPAPPAE